MGFQWPVERSPSFLLTRSESTRASHERLMTSVDQVISCLYIMEMGKGFPAYYVSPTFGFPLYLYIVVTQTIRSFRLEKQKGFEIRGQSDDRRVDVGSSFQSLPRLQSSHSCKVDSSCCVPKNIQKLS